MCQGELRIEAARGCLMPPECFAAVRPADPTATERPRLVHCEGFDSVGLCDIKGLDAPCAVDIFQRVARINVDRLEAGVCGEAKIKSSVASESDILLRVRVVEDEDDHETSETSSAGSSDSKNIEATPSTILPHIAPGGADGESSADNLFAHKSTCGSSLRSVTAENSDADVRLGFGDSDCEPQVVPPKSGRGRVFRFEDDGSSDSSCVGRTLSSSPDDRMTAIRFEERLLSEVPQHSQLHDCDQIIPNLHLGGMTAASDPELLVKLGIRAVVCCCRQLEFPDSLVCKDVDFYRADIEDMGREPLELYIPEATAFIHAHLTKDEPVLVHCRCGVSRSASLVIAYLVRYHGETLHDALLLTRSRRRLVTPNIGFMEKLREFEVEERGGGESTIDPNGYMAWYDAVDRSKLPDLRPRIGRLGLNSTATVSSRRTNWTVRTVGQSEASWIRNAGEKVCVPAA